MAVTKAAITKEVVLDEQLTSREIFTRQRESDLRGTLDELLASLGTSDAASPGTEQLIADRIASLRLELEQQIPAERFEIQRRLGTCRAEQASLNAKLLQQELESVNFGSDLALRQEKLKASVDAVRSDLSLFDARTGADLIHQPLTILEEFRRIEPHDQHLLMTIAILILGGIASLIAAYILEALRIARLGTLAN
jgi:hypothetical protein